MTSNEVFLGIRTQEKGSSMSHLSLNIPGLFQHHSQQPRNVWGYEWKQLKNGLLFLHLSQLKADVTKPISERKRFPLSKLYGEVQLNPKVIGLDFDK